MKERFRKLCLCCGKPFVTTKDNKVYITGHQKPNNNDVQNAKRKKVYDLNKAIAEAYQFYDDLLGENMSLEVSMAYLREHKIQLGWMTHMDDYKGQPEKHLHDIIILNNNTHLTLIRRKHA
jgi:hypothetical protein